MINTFDKQPSFFYQKTLCCFNSKTHNADTSIINKIRAAYENEKKLKKAYYIKLMDE